MAKVNDNPLGIYLKNRRAKVDPATLGIVSIRRRTPGLRREEVAQRANISATWYTWVEQGRGGTPSADVLEGIANALGLTVAEREHLFLLAQHRPPEVRYQAPEPVSPQLQRVIDAMPFCPAVVRTTDWDVVAWNRAASVILTDYAAMPPHERNSLRILFTQPRVRETIVDWEGFAHSMVAAFRLKTARAGASERVQSLVEELMRTSSEFAAFWQKSDVSNQGEGIKRFCHARMGQVTMEFSTFSVDGRPDLSLLVYTPATLADAARVRELLEEAV